MGNGLFCLVLNGTPFLLEVNTDVMDIRDSILLIFVSSALYVYFRGQRSFWRHALTHRLCCSIGTKVVQAFNRWF
jgi:hypothetical protein